MILPVRIVTYQDIHLVYDSNESLICSVANYEYSEKIRDAFNAEEANAVKPRISIWCNGECLGDWDRPLPMNDDEIHNGDKIYVVRFRRFLSDDEIRIMCVCRSWNEQPKVKEVETND